MLCGWESLAAEFLEQHVAREKVCFPLPNMGACGLAVFDSCIGVETSSNDEACDETPIGAFGRAGGSGRKSHPTWIGRACAQRGPRPAQSRRRRPKGISNSSE